MADPTAPVDSTTLESVVSDVRAVRQKAETARRNYTEGVLDPSHLDDVLDAARAAEQNAEALITANAGSPVPDGATTNRTIAEQAQAQADAEAQATAIAQAEEATGTKLPTGDKDADKAK